MPIRNDGGFDLVEPESQQIIPPKEWKKISELLEQGKQEEAQKIIDDLLAKLEEKK